MSRRLFPIVASTLVAGVASAGVAVAHDYGNHAPASAPKPAASKAKPARPSQPADLTPSRLSWSAYLTGEQEVAKDTGETDAGAANAKGSAVFQMINDQTVCYGFTLTGVTPPDAPTVVHVHSGGPGQNGPVVLTFANGAKNKDGQPFGNPGASSGCKTLTDPAEIASAARIRRQLRSKRPDRKQYYVNMHSTAFPDGAVRGQLSPLWYDAR